MNPRKKIQMMKIENKEDEFMQLFLLVTKKREKIINRAVKRLVRVAKHHIKNEAKKGILHSELVIEEAEIYDLPEDMYDTVYQFSADILNAYYKGEVNVEFKNSEMSYKRLEATILKI